MKHTLSIQKRLVELGYTLKLDGKMGEKTRSAIKDYQRSHGLDPDGVVGPRTEAVMFVQKIVQPVGTLFDVKSEKSLAKVHPELAKVIRLARKEVEFRVLDSSRGKAAQEKAFKEGRSKARFGQSAHNWDPAIAVDLFPAPYDWENIAAFDRLSKVMLRIAEEQNVPIRWGGDWNMDGDKTKSDAWDKPHYELHPWREWSKHSQPYKG